MMGVDLNAEGFKANQSGVLSPRQRWHYVAVRAAEHGIGALTALLVFAVSVHSLRLAPDLATIGAVAGGIALVTLVMLAFNLRPAFEARVQMVQGRLSRAVIAPPLLQPFYGVAVGNKLFYVTRGRFDALEEDALYQVYYLERPGALGGAHWLSSMLLPENPRQTLPPG